MGSAQALQLRQRGDPLGRGRAAQLGAQPAILLGQLRDALLPRLAEVSDAHRLDVERGEAEKRAGDRKPGEEKRGELAPAPPVPLAGQVQVLDPLRLRVGGAHERLAHAKERGGQRTPFAGLEMEGIAARLPKGSLAGLGMTGESNIKPRLLRDLFRHPQLRAPRARIAVHLGIRRPQRPPRQHLQRRTRPADALRQPRRAQAHARVAPEGVLDHAVLERVIRDDGEASASVQPRDGGREKSGERRQLLVDLDAQRLEDAGGRIDLLASPLLLRDDAGELSGRMNRLPRPFPHDAPRDLCRHSLLPHSRKIRVSSVDRCRGDDVRRRAAVCSHAHVEWTVTPEREAPARLVELHRRDAEIGENAVRRRMTREASSRSPKFASTRTTRSPKRASRRRAASSASASRSRPSSRTFGPRSRIASACPPAPTVASTKKPPRSGARNSTTSWSRTGTCGASATSHVSRLTSHASQQQLRQLVVVLGPELLLGRDAAQGRRDRRRRGGRCSP